MARVYLATAILTLGLGACGYNDSYNNETAYNDSGYVANATNYSEDANYSAEDANYSANAAGNEAVETNAAGANDVSNTTTNY